MKEGWYDRSYLSLKNRKQRQKKKLNDDPHPYYTMQLRSSGGDDVIDLSFDSVKV